MPGSCPIKQLQPDPAREKKSMPCSPPRPLPSSLVRICSHMFLARAIPDSSQLICFFASIVHASDPWFSKQVSNVERASFQPMFVCEMPLHTTKKKHTHISRTCELQIWTMSYHGSLQQTAPGALSEHWIIHLISLWMHAPVPSSKQAIVSRWHRRISLYLWWTHCKRCPRNCVRWRRSAPRRL